MQEVATAEVLAPCLALSAFTLESGCSGAWG